MPNTAPTASQQHFDILLQAVAERKQTMMAYLLQDRFVQRFRPDHIRDAVYSYVKSGGKSLRPSVAMLACGAVGGDESQALPIASAIEIYHTWTLVHDDVIDKDSTRRGVPTVHTEYAQKARDEFGWQGSDADHYGMTIAMLTGDVQQAWSWSLMFEAHTERGVSAEVVLQLAQEMASYTTPMLVEGETLDVQFSGKQKNLTEEVVIDMLWKKTGVLYEFAGRAGAAIGLNDANPDIPVVQAIAKFCSMCGTAFQIQDDILGIVGDAKQLGKPVGSDIREGKYTVLTLKALDLADDAQRNTILKTLGDGTATDDSIADVTNLLRELDVIRYAQDISRKYVDEAVQHLQKIPPSEYKTLLGHWAEYLIDREF
jgi:geranylgeranyl diphosphate synthase, type I